MLKKIIIFCTFFLFNPYVVNAEESKQVILNRLTTLSVSVETLSPVVNTPAFVIPPGIKVVNSYLKTNFTDKYHVEFEILLFCEKHGNYAIGPFVFKDKEGNNYTAPPINITTSPNESIPLIDKVKASSELPPKFYTSKNQDNIFTHTPVYFVLEIPTYYKLLEVIWPGWDNIYTEMTPEIKTKDDKYELKFIVFFSKGGKYAISPIKFNLKRDEKELLFSSAALNFDVNELQEDTETVGVGDGNFKIATYTSTNKNIVQIDVKFSGKGNLYNLKAPQISITPYAAYFLKKKEIEILDFFPEINGNVSFSYIFFPQQDGVYSISTTPAKIFDFTKNAFKNLSGIATSVNVMLPSNPLTNQQNGDLSIKLNIKQKPDYDFYAIIVGMLFITALSIGLYLRNTQKKKKTLPKIDSSYKKDHLVALQRAILAYLKFFTGTELLTSSLSQIKDAVNSTDLPLTIKNEIIDWLELSFKHHYLKRGDIAEESFLKEKGKDLLRKMKELRNMNDRNN